MDSVYEKCPIILEGFLMIETKELNIDGVLQTARKQANKKQTPAFVSITEQIEELDPLAFFNTGKYLGLTRTFWTNTDRSIYFVGVGNAYTMQAINQPYTTIKQQWQELINDAIIDNPYPNSSAGPIVLGGFPFDQANEKDPSLWKGFEGSQFRLPRFMLTKDKEKYYFTINVFVEPNSNTSQLEQQLQIESQQLLNGKEMITYTNAIHLQHEVDPEQWKDLVQKVTNDISEGKVDKIVLARELQIELKDNCDLTEVLRNLLIMQPNSYVFAWEKNNACFIGATPERLVQVNKKQLFSTCLAGTAPRGKDKKDDDVIGQALLQDEKNQKEHQFVVDMIRGAVTSCARKVHIPDKPILYPLKNLQHLYTPVQAELKRGHTILDVVAKLHPTPALSGYPSETSLSFIREFETLERGWYGAPIGWMDDQFNGEFAVAIRSALVRENKVSLFAGCGVVEDSDPEQEYKETSIKFTPMLQALGGHYELS